jgi:hypothetical protein
LLAAKQCEDAGLGIAFLVLQTSSSFLLTKQHSDGDGGPCNTGLKTVFVGQPVYVLLAVVVTFVSIQVGCKRQINSSRKM